MASDEVRYTTGQVWDAVVTATGGFRPHIDCIRIEGEAYITEVKVCYTKNLTRVDCDGIKAVKGQTGDMMGTCLRYTSLNPVYGNHRTLLSLVLHGFISGIPKASSTRPRPRRAPRRSSCAARGAWWRAWCAACWGRARRCSGRDTTS